MNHKKAKDDRSQILFTEAQKRAMKEFLKETGDTNSVPHQVEVVNDKISPASIQVGTAK